MQLYLDGPKDKLFNIFNFESNLKEKIIINKNFKVSSFLNNKKLSTVKNAQNQALIKAFINKKIPFREFKIKKINEETLGELLSFFIFETVIIAKLINTNPFDQPAVEQVKKFTKEILT